MSANLETVYTAGTDAAVRSWRASGEDFSYDAGQGAVTGLSFSNDGSRVASAAGGSIRVFDRSSGGFPVDVSTQDALLAVFSPDDRSLLSVAGSGVSLLDATTGAEVRLLSTAPGGALGGSFSPDGKRVLAPGSGTGSSLFVYDTADGNLLQIIPVERGALSMDGSRAVGWFAGRYSIYDTSTGQSLIHLSLPGADTRAVDIQFTPDGTRVVSGDHDNVVRVRDAVTLETLLEMPGHGGPIRQIRVSADGRYALSAGYDGTARYWDLETGALVRLFPGHDGRALTSIAIAPDGQTVALGSSDGTVIVAPTSIDSVITEVCGRVARELTDVDRLAYELDSADVPCP
jgi:WD40 repeat protein